MRTLVLSGIIAVATAWLYFGWVTALLPSDYIGGVIIDPFVAFVPSALIGVAGLAFVLLLAPLFRLRARRLWRAKSIYLNNSNHCFRDDIIFNADFNHASPERFIGALYSITPRMVMADALAPGSSRHGDGSALGASKCTESGSGRPSVRAPQCTTFPSSRRVYGLSLT